MYLQNIITCCSLQWDLSSPKPGHTKGGSRRGARRGGGAGSGRIVCQQNCSPREQSFLALSKTLIKRLPELLPEAQTSEIQCKPIGEQNPQLTTGSSAVYQRFISGTKSALSCCLPASGTTHLCFCSHFECKPCQGTCVSMLQCHKGVPCHFYQEQIL